MLHRLDRGRNAGAPLERGNSAHTAPIPGAVPPEPRTGRRNVPASDTGADGGSRAHGGGVLPQVRTSITSYRYVGAYSYRTARRALCHEPFSANSQRTVGSMRCPETTKLGTNNPVGNGLLRHEELSIKTTHGDRPSPSEVWMVIDENPDSINEGAFFDARGGPSMDTRKSRLGRALSG